MVVGQEGPIVLVHVMSGTCVRNGFVFRNFQQDTTYAEVQVLYDKLCDHYNTTRIVVKGHRYFINIGLIINSVCGDIHCTLKVTLS